VAIPALWLIVEYLPAPLFAGFIVSVVAVGLYEYFEMALPDHPPERMAGMLYGIIVAGGVVSGRPEVWGAGLAVALVGGFVAALARSGDLAAGMHRLGLSLVGVLYVGFFIAHAVLLRATPEGWRWVLFTVFTSMASDTGGYFAGRFWGRHKLAPTISPSKTVEGTFGAVAGAMLLAWLCAVVFHPSVGGREALLLGAAISLLAQLGDLCESALKRAFGAKDSGWIIPGHGGILDRLDSIVFPMVFAYYYTAFPRG
jgi:phosphatidate cytidylyltransferase